MDVKDSCVFYADWLEAAHTIEDTKLRCCFFEAVLQYALTGMEMETPPELKIVMTIVKKCIDRDREKYEKKIEKRRAAGRLGALVTNEKRWGYQDQSADVSKCQQTSANADNCQQTSPDNVNVNDNVNANVNVKDNDFKNTPIPPKGGRVLDFEDFYHRVKAVSIPKAIEEMHYERQYAWRMAEGIPGYGVEVSDAIKTKSKPYLQDYIGEINKKYQPCTPFEQLLLAMSLSKLKTKAQEAAVLEELKRSYDEPGIFRTLTDKADYIIGGGAVSSLAGFMKSRKQ